MTNWFLYIVSVLIWGSTWFAIEFQLGAVPADWSVVYRFLVAAILLFAWCLIRRRNLRFDWRTHRYFLLMGAFLFGLNYIIVYNAQLYIDSALNAVVFTSIVWLNILNARLLLGVRIDSGTYVGALLGLLGVGILFWPQIRGTELSEHAFLGAGMSFAGACIASLGNIISAKAQQQRVPVVQANAWGMLYGCLLCALITTLRGQPMVFDPTPAYVTALLYLAVFGSVIGFWAYLTLLGRIGAHRAGYSMVMFPVVAVVLSALFEGLRLTPNVWGGIGLTLLGNVFVLSRLTRAR